MAFDFTESLTLELPDTKSQLIDFKESFDYRENNKLIVEVAAIHAGLTSNYNMYPEYALKASLDSWVSPYPKPIILNHDQYSESIGRVMAAKMDNEEDGTPFVRLQIAVLDPIAIEKVLDQRYLTGSVGGQATSAACSICGVDWAKEESRGEMPCRHRRGKIYEGKLAYLEVRELSFKEYSFVNMPADQNSGIRAITKDIEDSEQWTRSVKMFSLDMNKESIVDMSESESSLNILTEMKRREAKAVYNNLKGTFLTVSAFDLTELSDKESDFNVINDTNKNESYVQCDSEKNDEQSFKENIMPEQANEAVQENEDDLLQVTEQLSADLAQQANEDASVENPVEETDDSEESAELSENSDVETDADDLNQQEAEVETEEAATEQLDVEEGVEQASADSEIETEESSSEVEPEVEEAVEESDDDSEKDALIAELSEQNAKLKQALRSMLAERVVDMKIFSGLESHDNRAALVEEHSTRTASSLADAIRDLQKYPSRSVVAEDVAKVFEAQNTAIVSSSDETNVEESDLEEEVSDNETWEDRAVHTFTDVLMGRAKF